MEYNPHLPWYRRLHWQVAAAMLAGVGVGLAGGEGAASALGWLGDLFMRLLRMIIVPLVLTSIVSGVASVGGGRAIGRLFSKTLGYYVTSSLLAACVGVLMFNLWSPGRGADLSTAASQQLPELATPTGIDLLLNVVPRNFIDAMASGDMLAIIFFCIVFGAAITTLPDKPRAQVTDIFESFFKVMMNLTSGIIKFLPIGVFALITRMVGNTGFEAFAPLLKYVGTLGSGLAIHFLVTLPLLLMFVGRINPWLHLRNMRNALLTAFSTSSSAATLPVTINAVRKRVGVSNKVSSFVLPMGATVNMDGTAVFECIGALFIAQVLGIEITVTQQFLVVATALLASIGAAAVPSAGLVIIFIVLDVIGLGDNANAVAIVGMMLAIDRPLDMCRTAVNVYSDSCGAAIIARSEGEEGVDTEVR